MYFDASGVMRYLVRNRRGHEFAQYLWTAADQRISASITYVEVRAALAAGRRNRHWGEAGLRDLKRAWWEAWRELNEIAIDGVLLARAGDLAEAEGLRGFDAVQLTAAQLSGCDLFVAADRRLCDAARHMHLRVIDLDQVEG